MVAGCDAQRPAFGAPVSPVVVGVGVVDGLGLTREATRRVRMPAPRMLAGTVRVCRVAELIAAVDHLVHPDHRMFGIGEAPAGFGEQSPTPGGGWLGVGHASVLFGVGDDFVRTTLRVEHWDGEPPSPPPDYDAQETIRLRLPTGRIGLNEITFGGRDLGLCLPPGEYDVRLTEWDVEPMTYPEGPGSAPQGGAKHYLAQFWLRTPAPALLQSTAVRIHPGYDRVAIVDDAASVRRVPPIGPERFAVDDNAPLVQFRYGQAHATLRIEFWAGPPPAWYGAPAEAYEPVQFQLPSGRIHLLHLPPGDAGIREINNGRILLEQFPPGAYHLSLTTVGPNYLARFWPATGTT